MSKFIVCCKMEVLNREALNFLQRTLKVDDLSD